LDHAGFLVRCATATKPAAPVQKGNQRPRLDLSALSIFCFIFLSRQSNDPIIAA
jgi:hypothetical protein